VHENITGYLTRSNSRHCIVIILVEFDAVSRECSSISVVLRCKCGTELECNSRIHDSMYSVVCFLLFKQPPSLPTSKNYPEMRERLRLRLKKKVRHLFCADF